MLGRLPGEGSGHALLHLDQPRDRHPLIAAKPAAEQAAFVKAMVKLLDGEGSPSTSRATPTRRPGFALGAGATVEPDDMALLLPWLDWAFASTKSCGRLSAPSPPAALSETPPHRKRGPAMFRVLIADKLSPAAVAIFEERGIVRADV